MSRPIQASDAGAWFACPRRAWYDHNPPPGKVEADPFRELVAGLGIEHEHRVRERLGARVEARSAAHTRELMAAREPAIYQPVLEADGAVGRPDFLVLEDGGRYRVADAKLAVSLDTHPEIVVQLAFYRRLLGSPLPARVYLGDGQVAEVGDEVNPMLERFLAGMRRVLEADEPPAAGFSASRCGACAYEAVCRPAFEAAGELTLLYGVDTRVARALRDQGIGTVRALASADPDEIQPAPYLRTPESRRRLVAQARSRLDGEVRVLDARPLPGGTWVHFDVESNPLDTPVQVYLWGLLPPPYEPDAYAYTWSDGGPEDDRRAWTGFLDAVRRLRAASPDLRIAHYSSYEVIWLRQYAERYGMTADPVVEWLLGEDGPLLDLARHLRQALVLPVDGYGLKTVCRDPRLVSFQWALPESGSQWSVVRYVQYLAETDPAGRDALREELLSYNRDDVRASRALERWMRRMLAGAV